MSPTDTLFFRSYIFSCGLAATAALTMLGAMLAGADPHSTFVEGALVGLGGLSAAGLAIAFGALIKMWRE